MYSWKISQIKGQIFWYSWPDKKNPEFIGEKTIRKIWRTCLKLKILPKFQEINDFFVGEFEHRILFFLNLNVPVDRIVNNFELDKSLDIEGWVYNQYHASSKKIQLFRVVDQLKFSTKRDNFLAIFYHNLIDV